MIIGLDTNVFIVKTILTKSLIMVIIDINRDDMDMKMALIR